MKVRVILDEHHLVMLTQLVASAKGDLVEELAKVEKSAPIRFDIEGLISQWEQVGLALAHFENLGA